MIAYTNQESTMQQALRKSAQRQETIVAFRKEAAIESAAENWKKKMTLLKEAEAQAEEAEAELLAACNKSSYEGKGIKVVEIERKGSVDYGSIPELKGIDLEPYRKSSVKYWKISLSFKE